MAYGNEKQIHLNRRVQNQKPANNKPLNKINSQIKN
jgi:hypothetical protein